MGSCMLLEYLQGPLCLGTAQTRTSHFLETTFFCSFGSQEISALHELLASERAGATYGEVREWIIMVPIQSAVTVGDILG